MSKLDLSKTLNNYYKATKTPQLVELPKAFYLSIEGQGDPSGEAFQKNIQALYTLAYAIKFMHKAKQQDFVVPKLEAQWWYDETLFKGVSISEAPQKIPRDLWYFRLLIQMPGYVKADDLQVAQADLPSSKKTGLTNLVSWYNIAAGRFAQVLHSGPFDKEPESLLILAGFMNQHNLKRNGFHQEVYLSDFRKTAPEKLKTILREPVL